MQTRERRTTTARRRWAWMACALLVPGLALAQPAPADTADSRYQLPPAPLQAVVDAVAQHVQQRIRQLVEDGPVELDLRARNHQVHLALPAPGDVACRAGQREERRAPAVLS